MEFLFTLHPRPDPDKIPTYMIVDLPDQITARRVQQVIQAAIERQAVRVSYKEELPPISRTSPESFEE